MAKNLTDEVVSASPSVNNKIDAAAETFQNKHNGEMSETDILNFALNLEYLEAEFYTYASTGKSITSLGIGIDGVATGANPAHGGSTVGGVGRVQQQRPLQRRRCAPGSGRTSGLTLPCCVLL